MIVEWNLMLAFLPAACALNLMPGSDMMSCLGQGLRAGPRAALVAEAGISVGDLLLVTLAGLGLGAALLQVPGLFDALRWVGAAYLLWLAYLTCRASPQRPDMPAEPPGRAFRSGLGVNLTNPKVILFVLAFIPQFVDPTRPVLPQFLLFGGVLAIGGLIVNGSVGALAGGAGQRLLTSAGFALWLGRASTAVFVALAAHMIWGTLGESDGD